MLLGTLLHDCEPTDNASESLRSGFAQMYGEGEVKPGKVDSKKMKRFFPHKTDEIQGKMRQALDVAVDASPATTQKAFKEKRPASKCDDSGSHRAKSAKKDDRHRAKSAKKSTADKLSQLKVNMLRRDAHGNLIKTLETGKPSRTKVPIATYSTSFIQCHTA